MKPAEAGEIATMPKGRPIAWMITALACGAMVICGFAMASRIAEFHRANPREVYAFQKVSYKEFEFAGRSVTFTDEDQNGIWYLGVKYGDESLRLRVTIPRDRRLPGLEPHGEWMRALLFSSATGKTISQVQADLSAGKATPRMVIVTRTPRPGEPEAYAGRMNSKAWVFDFYELKPEGGFDHQRLKFPTTKQHQPDKEGELHENTWQYQAALSVIPKGISPRPKFTNDGLKAAGWTLPATSLSMLMMLAGLAISARVDKRS